MDKNSNWRCRQFFFFFLEALKEARIYFVLAQILKDELSIRLGCGHLTREALLDRIPFAGGLFLRAPITLGFKGDPKENRRHRCSIDTPLFVQAFF